MQMILNITEVDIQPHLKIQFIKTVCKKKKKSVLSAELNAIDSALDIISEWNIC